MLATNASVENALASVRVSLAQQPADMLLANCQLVNVWSEEIYTSSVAIAGSRIVAIRPGYEGTARHIIDCSGRYLLPGFVEPFCNPPADAEALAAVLVPMGVTSIVLAEAEETSPDQRSVLRRWRLARERLGWRGSSGNARLVHGQRVCFTVEDAASAVAEGMAAVLEAGFDPARRLDLLRSLAEADIETARLMLSHCGESDALAKVFAVRPVLGAALEAGFPVHPAVQMTGFNAAVQHGIEHEVGSVAPGRLADLMIVDDLAQRVPSVVILDGRIVARDGLLEEAA